MYLFSEEQGINNSNFAFQLTAIHQKIIFTYFSSGSLSPSQRRSLFTLATSMIFFSSEAYNIVPLVKCAKVVLTEKMVCELLVMKFQCLLFEHILGSHFEVSMSYLT